MISTPNDGPANDDVNTTFRLALALAYTMAGVPLAVIAGLLGADPARPAAG
jgi:L-serine deaminase